MPHAVHQRPRDEGAYLRSVAHHARMDIAHAVGVVVGEAQSLQLGKCRIAQIAVDLHLGAEGEEKRHVVDQRGRQHGDHEERHVVGHGVQRGPNHKVIERIALEHGQDDIHHTAKETAGDHGEDATAVHLEEGQEVGYAEELEFDLLIPFHSSSTPAVCA